MPDLGEGVCVGGEIQKEGDWLEEFKFHTKRDRNARQLIKVLGITSCTHIWCIECVLMYSLSMGVVRCMYIIIMSLCLCKKHTV